jgi:hypothetical protein
MIIENRIIIEELRKAIKGAFIKREEVLMSAIDAITVEPNFNRPVEITKSPYWQYKWVSLFTGIREGKEEQSIERLRRRRLNWLEGYGETISKKPTGLGDWQVRILDATNYERPKAETVPRSFVHSAEGMKAGHCLSMLSEYVGSGSWVLPLEIKLVDNNKIAREFGPQQMVEFVKQHRWPSNYVLAVDADYTKEPVLRPMKEAGINVLGRVGHKRKFYLPPPPYAGRGRPAVRGRKIKLKDARTLPVPDLSEKVDLEKGRKCEISCWQDVRMFAWPEQTLVLYRIVEYCADGSLRYKRPLWLIYLQANGSIPSLAQARAIYECRFGIEHSIRFLKSQLGLTSGQFNGQQAHQRIALWVELVATAFWQLAALKAEVGSQTEQLPRWWTNKTLTPGSVHRLALSLFIRLGILPFKPLPRGKSPGRVSGTHFLPRKRFKIYRKRKRRRAA